MGDRAKFVEEVLPIAQSLYGVALSLTRNPSDAEDLIQETLLKAFRSYDTFKEGTNLKAWLYRIMMNTFINIYRAKQRRPQEVALSGEVQRHAESSAEAICLESLEADSVQHVVSTVRDPFQQVVYLVDVEGFSYKEVAEALGIPLGTVMSRLHRGRKALREKLQSVNEES